MLVSAMFAVARIYNSSYNADIELLEVHATEEGAARAAQDLAFKTVGRVELVDPYDYEFEFSVKGMRVAYGSNDEHNIYLYVVVAIKTGSVL